MVAQPLLLPLLLAGLLTLSFAADKLTKLPSYVRKCSIKDPEVEKCALEHAREALPKLVKGYVRQDGQKAHSTWVLTMVPTTRRVVVNSCVRNDVSGEWLAPTNGSAPEMTPHDRFPGRYPLRGGEYPPSNLEGSIEGDEAEHIPVLDPLQVTEVRIQTGSEPTALDMTCKNIVLKGLANTELVHVGINPKDSVYSATCKIPRLEIDTDYTVDGHVLVLPIKGSGKGNFTFENVNMYYEQKYTLEKRGDKTYLNYPDSKGIFNCSRAYFQMENLFNGDEKLGNEVNTFLNENWHQVVDDLGQPFVDAASKVIREFALTILGNVPYDEIWDDADV